MFRHHTRSSAQYLIACLPPSGLFPSLVIGAYLLRYLSLNMPAKGLKKNPVQPVPEKRGYEFGGPYVFLELYLSDFD
jgi:hypothetical protein